MPTKRYLAYEAANLIVWKSMKNQNKEIISTAGEVVSDDKTNINHREGLKTLQVHGHSK